MIQIIIFSLIFNPPSLTYTPSILHYYGPNEWPGKYLYYLGKYNFSIPAQADRGLSGQTGHVFDKHKKSLLLVNQCHKSWNSQITSDIDYACTPTDTKHPWPKYRLETLSSDVSQCSNKSPCIIKLGHRYVSCLDMLRASW